MGTLSRVAVSLLAALFVIAGCHAAPQATATTQPKPTTTAERQRSTLIDDNWRFIRTDVPAASAADYDDSTWEPVTLPHTWNVTDGSDGGNNYYRGPGWYRRTLDVDGDALKFGKCFYLRFGAASLVADVFVNGQHVGQHRGGFAAFCYDVTAQLHAGRNSVSVRVDNRRQEDVAPLSGDFTVFGGLYRDVELLVLNPLHISPIDDASSGVYIKQLAVTPEEAELQVTTIVRNTSSAPARGFIAASTLRSPREYSPTTRDGLRHLPMAGEPPMNSVRSEEFIIAPNASMAVKAILRIDDPVTWNGGSGSPRTWLKVTVYSDWGVITDNIETKTGLRTVAIDSARGLLLNGQPYAAHGVDVHQEVGGKGWAGSSADYDETYKFVREMGATAVRMAHYQHNPAEYDACDRLGILVWSEIPFVNEFGKPPAFAENLKQQLRELIKQNYNHPSIVTWGLLNEVGLKDTDPNWQIVRDCNALAHELDPSRPTTVAQNTGNNHGSLKVPDVIAFNRYFGWYSGSADQWPAKLDADHAANPGKAMGMSEYGAGGSAFQHELNPARVDPNSEWHPEEYQCLVHEAAYRAMKQRPWLWGTFIWVMFDFSADHRQEGDHTGRNDKGMITFDRKTKKDVFYFYQANWTTTPMVHITSARYDPYPIGRSDVKVYSNCDTVELVQNGKSIGTATGEDGVFIFKDVGFEAGTVETIARGVKGDAHIEDRVTRTVSTQASSRTTTRPATKPTTRSATAATH